MPRVQLLKFPAPFRWGSLRIISEAMSEIAKIRSWSRKWGISDTPILVPPGGANHGAVEWLLSLNRSARPPILWCWNAEGAKLLYSLRQCRNAFRSDDVWIVASQSEAKLLRAWVKDGPLVVVVALPVAPSFAPASAKVEKKLRQVTRKQLGLTKNSVIFLATGRRSDQKNPAAALLAFARFRSRFQKENPQYEAQLWWCGAVDTLGFPHFGRRPFDRARIRWENRRYAILARELKREGAYREWGQLSQQELRSVCAAADVQVSLSTHYGEDFGYALAQGFSWGLPAMITRWGGHLGFLRSTAVHGIPITLSRGRPLPMVSLAEMAFRKFASFSTRGTLPMLSRKVARELRPGIDAESWAREVEKLAREAARTKNPRPLSFTVSPAIEKHWRKKRNNLFASPRDPLYRKVLAVYRGAFFGIAMAIVLSAAPPAAKAAVDTGWQQTDAVLGCGAHSNVQRVEVRGKLILNEEILKASGQRARSIADAVQLQAKYVMGFLKDDVEAHRDGAYATGAILETPHAYAEHPAPYPYSMQIDAFRGDGDASSHPYVQAAVKRGKTVKGEPGVEVDYVWIMELAFCARAGSAAPAALPETWVPADPFLPQWIVPASERRPMHYGPHQSVVSPCAYYDYAEFGRSREFWYFWDPRAKRQDDNGHAFDCSKMYALSDVATPVEWTLLATHAPWKGSPVLLRKAGDRTPLKMTVVIGNLERQLMRQVDLALLRKQLPLLGKTPSPGTELIWNEVPQHPKFSGQKPELKLIFETGGRELLLLLHYLPQFATITQASVLPLPKGIDPAITFDARIRGKLLASGTPLDLRVHYGQTVEGTPAKTDQYRVVWDALKDNQILVYMGHAGMGTTMKKSMLLEKLGRTKAQLDRQLRSNPRLLMTILACYSYSYFGHEYAAERRELGLPTDLMLSGQKDVGSRYVLGMLHAIDASSAGDSVDLSTLLVRYTPPGEFVVLESFEPSKVAEPSVPRTVQTPKPSVRQTP